MVDSSDFHKPVEDVVAMGHGMHAAGDCAFSDFNWARLNPWRDVLASFFDGPDLLPYLGRVQTISMECTGATKARGLDVPKALLLVGWLASALGLHASNRQIESDHVSLNLEGAGRSVTVEIHTGRKAGGSVKLVAAGDSGPSGADFSASLDHGESHITGVARVSGQARGERRVAVLELEESRLLFEELEIFGRDAGYETALKAVSAILDPQSQREVVKGSLLV